MIPIPLDTVSSALDSDHDFLPLPAAPAAHQVVIIDANVIDAATLASAAPAGSLVFMLDGARSGVEQVGEILKSLGQVDSVHLVSHGGAGYFLLGSDVVTSDTASHYAAQFQSWGASLQSGADLLFYGCNVAASTDGQALVEQIGQWTGADVAASTNLSGLHGDWVLEYQQGVVEAQALAGQAYQHDLTPLASTFLVTTLDDQAFVNGSTLAAAQADGLSLREALALAKGNNTLDTILFAPSLFADGQMHTMTLSHGQLDIAGTSDADGLNIVGVGSSLLTIDANKSSRVFDGYSNPRIYAATTISGMTLTNGQADSSLYGGAIRMYGSGSLALDHVVIKDSASDRGGAVYFNGGSSNFTMTHSTISGNTAVGSGGGLFISTTGTSVISGSTIAGNAGGDLGGGMHIFGQGKGIFSLTNSTIDGNTTTNAGGGVFIWTSYGATLTNNTVTNNSQSATSTTSGGGIAAQNSDRGDVKLYNNFLSGNTAATAGHAGVQGADVFVQNTTVKGTHNILNQVGVYWNTGGSSFNGTNSLTGSITSAPAIGALTDNGGPVQTRAILTGTSASNGGTATGAPTEDARGFVRGGNVDIGAYELNDSGTFNFTGSLFPPSGYSYVPADADLTLDFGQSVAAVAGKNIVIHHANGSVFETFDATDARVTIAGNVVTLNPSANLALSTDYYVTIDAGAFTAGSGGKTFAGISGASAWSFKTDSILPATSVSIVSLLSDTGSSSTDFITNIAAQTVTATLSAALVGGDVLKGSVDGGTNWVDITNKVSGTNVSWDGVTLSGTSSLKFKVNSGGIDGRTTTKNYVLDTTAPSVPGAPDLDSASDLGTSSTDNLTSRTTPTFTGSREVGTTIKLYDGNTSTPLGTDTVSSGSWSVMSSTLSEGAHTVYVTATDVAGNETALSTGLTVTIDTTAPTVTSINRVGATATGAASVDYTVTFAESVTGVDKNDFTLNKGGSANGTIASITGSGTTYTVTVNTVSGDGALRLDLNTTGTGIADAAGNAIATTGYTSGESYTLDHTGPTVGSVGVPSSTTYSAGQQLDFTVNFNEAVTVTGTPRIAVTLDTGGTVYATYVSGGGGTALLFRYTVVNGNADADGVTLGGSIDLNSGTLKDALGNNATLTLNNVGTLTGVHVNATAPEVSSISLVNPASNNLSSVDYTVVFSSAVTGVDASDFTLTGSGVTGNIANVTADANGTTYTVTVDTIVGDGTLRLDLKSANTGIIDGASNPIASGYTSGAAYTIDHTAPAVTSVAAPSSSTYKTGGQLDFTVNFTEAVTVVTTGGTPTIDVTLDTGGTVQAQYVSGTGTNALVFRYVAASGNLDANGVALAGPIALNGATLKDTAGNNAALALNNIATLTGVLVDAVAPTVTSINRVGAALTGAATVDYTVTFAENVTGVDTTDFTLNKGGTANGSIASVSGSGSTYTVTVNTLTGDGALRLDLNGASTGITDTAGNAIATTGYTSGQSYTLDHTGPTVGSVTVPGDTTYNSGATLDFTVNFNEAVTVTGTPRIAITLDGGTTVYATYVSGGNGTALLFRYTVGNGQVDSDGVTLGSAIDLNSGTLKDALGNDATLTLNNVGALTGVLVNGVAPEVSSISLVNPASNNLTSVDYTVVFSSAVTGVDASDFTLTGSGVTGNIANVTAVVGGTTYTVTVDTIVGDGTLRLDLKSANTGIIDAATNAIASGYTAGSVYTIDHTGPAVGSVTAPASGSYKAGGQLDFTVNFNEAVTVVTTGGTPTMEVTLDTGGTVQAQYVSGTGSNALVFRYTVANGNMDANGVALAGPIALNGGSLKDALGNDATLALANIGALTGVLVDTQTPYLGYILRADPQYSNGSTVHYNLTFDESVTGVDTGDFSLNTTGSAAGNIASISGSGANYVVTIDTVSGDGQLRLDLKTSGTGIADLAGNLIPDGGRTGNQSYTLDHTGPTVGSVTVPGDTTYNSGATLDFTVNFNEAVTVTGTPRIAITLDGTTTVYATYVSGGNGTALLFRYTVGNGQVDSDGVTLGSAIDLNSGTLKDAFGNDATLTLNNVGALTGVLVNGVAPEVSSISLVNPASNNLTSVDYTVVFSSAVTGVDASDFTLTGSGVTGNISNVSGSGTSYTVTVDTIVGDGTLRLDLKSANTGIIDAATNAIASGYTSGAVYTIDHTAPAVTSVAAPSSSTYKTGGQLDFTVNFNEAVTVVTTGGTPTIDVTLDTGGTVQAQYVSGTGSNALVFRYTVASGNMDANGVALAGPIALNGGSLKDALGNDATLALANIGALTGVLVDTQTPYLGYILRADPQYSNGGTVHYNLTFDESVTGVDTGDFSLYTTGTAAGNIASISGSGANYVVTIDTVSGDGQLRLDLKTSGTGIADLAGNLIPDGGRTGNQSYTLDHTAPTVSTVGVPVDNTYRSGGQLDFTVNFSEAVTVTGSPRIPVTIAGPSTVYAEYVSGGGTAALVFRYVVATGQLDGDGVALAAIDLNGGSLKDAAGNNATLTLNGVGALGGVLVNGTGPEVSSVSLVNPASNNLTSVDYTVVFSSAVTGVDVSDFALVGTGVAGTVAAVAGSGTTYTVTVNNLTGDGTLRLDVKATGTGIVDTGSSALLAGYTTGPLYTFDHSAPSAYAVGVPAERSYKAGESLIFTVSYSEAVTVAGGAPSLTITLDNGATAQAVYIGGSGGTALTFRYVVGSGDVGANGVGLAGALNLNGATVQDGFGNDATLALNGVGALAGVRVDAQAPSVASINRVGAELTHDASVAYAVTFSESVSGVDAGDFALAAGGGVAGSITSVSGSGTSYTVTVGNVTGDGTLRLDLNGAGTGIADVAGNALAGGFGGGQQYTFDHTAPTATVSLSDLQLTAGETAQVTVTFSEAVTGFSNAKVSVPGGSLTAFTSADGGLTWSATLTPNGGVNTLGNVLTLELAGVVDKAGNSGSGTVTSNGFSVATTVPTATVVVGDSVLTAGETAPVTITFSEAVSGFDLADLSASGGTLSALTSSDGITWTALFTPTANSQVSGNVITLNKAGVVNAAGNAGSGQTVSNSYAVDTVPVTPPVVIPPVVTPPVVTPPVVTPPVTLPVTPGRSTVDGVILDTAIVTDPATGQSSAVIVIPVIPVTRPDDPNTPNSTLADIPLGLTTGAGAGAVSVSLTVSLPTGTGLSVDGSTALLTNEQALLDLIRRIEQKTEPGTPVQNEMTGLGKEFLNKLFADVMLQSMTLTPSVAPNSTTAQTIQITGGSSTPATGHNPGAIGLVIDTTGLPDNAVLQLNDVDFAAIVGSATLRGGDGQNFVIGDGESQNILLGADDDLLFGGGGNDVIGSAGGNDILDGGSGNDSVAGGIGNDSLTGGTGNDVLQGGRSDSGAWQFFIDRSGALVGKHQTALFAPLETETLARADLNAQATGLSFLGAPQEKLLQLAGLYQAAFGRVADLPGLAFWASDSGSLQTTAESFLGSSEWLSNGNGQLTDTAFVQKLYEQALGRVAGGAELQFWLDYLSGTSGTAALPAHSRADVLLGFALSTELQGRLNTSAGVKVGAGTLTQESGWIAGGGDDRLDGGAGSDWLVGGDGTDTVVYTGRFSDYKLLLGTDGQVRIADKSNGDVDVISGIEKGAFGADTIDLSFTQAATSSLRTLGLMYQSVLDRSGDLGGFTGWIGQHLSTQQLAQGFTGSSEFKARYDGVTDVAFVHALYQNTGIDGMGLDERGWVIYLDTHTRAELIAQWVSTDEAISAQFAGAGLWLV